MRSFFGVALFALGAGALAGLYATRVERARVQLSRYEVVLDVPGLPSDGLTILHLSDFHFRAGGAVQARKIERLLAALAHETYDVVALTGDLIHDRAGFAAALRLAERPEIRFNVGLALYMSGEQETGLAHLVQATKLNPAVLKEVTAPDLRRRLLERLAAEGYTQRYPWVGEQ